MFGPSMNPSVHYGRGWKDPIGKVLTDRRINKYKKLTKTRKKKVVPINEYLI